MRKIFTVGIYKYFNRCLIRANKNKYKTTMKWYKLYYIKEYNEHDEQTEKQKYISIITSSLSGMYINKGICVRTIMISYTEIIYNTMINKNKYRHQYASAARKYNNKIIIKLF